MEPTVEIIRQRLLSRGYNPQRWVLTQFPDGVRMTFTPLEYQRHRAEFLYKVDGYQMLFPEFRNKLVETSGLAPYLLFSANS